MYGIWIFHQKISKKEEIFGKLLMKFIIIIKRNGEKKQTRIIGKFMKKKTWNEQTNKKLKIIQNQQ